MQSPFQRFSFDTANEKLTKGYAANGQIFSDEMLHGPVDEESRRVAR